MLVSFAAHVRTTKPSSMWCSFVHSIYFISCRSGILEDHTSSYFSHNNVEATKLREQLAEDSLEMLIRWLKKGGNVAIHGTSSLSTPVMLFTPLRCN